MTISASCTHCGTTFQLADQMAGKQARCSRCKGVFSIPVAGLFASPKPAIAATASAQTRPAPPAPPMPPAQFAAPPSPPAFASTSVDDEDEFRLAPEEPAVNVAKLFAPPPPPRNAATASAQGASLPTASSTVKEWTPPATRGRWRDHTHWALLIALIPLIIQTGVELVSPRDDSKVTHQIEYDEEGNEVSIRFSSPDAFLPRDSKLHWLFAAVSAGVFATALALFNDDRKLHTWMLLLIGLATGTAGIFLLLAFQFIAFAMPLRIIPRGIIGLILLVIALIGLSYRCALDPSMGFIPSFFGFVFGVGLCEELVKSIPIVIYLQQAEYSRWRVAMLVGLASGAGFGVSEGVMYSADMYNGYADASIYLVRFTSCVALHAIWAGCVGLMMHFDQETLFDEFNFITAGMFVFKYLSIVMVLHGLYDVLLKQELPWVALLVGLASFGWLAYLVHRSEGTEWSTAMHRTA